MGLWTGTLTQADRRGQGVSGLTHHPFPKGQQTDDGSERTDQAHELVEILVIAFGLSAVKAIVTSRLAVNPIRNVLHVSLTPVILMIILLPQFEKCGNAMSDENNACDPIPRRRASAVDN
jgi:uncharacterized protein YcaQ